MGTRSPSNFKWDKGKKKLTWTRDTDPNVDGYEVFVGPDEKNVKYVGYYHQTKSSFPGDIPEDPGIDAVQLLQYGLTLPEDDSLNDLKYAFAHTFYEVPEPTFLTVAIKEQPIIYILQN